MGAQIQWPELSTRAFEIVAFGSRALGVNEKSSDLDVLVVGGAARRIKSTALDLICIPHSDLASEAWLTSELATHISQYGVWIVGSGEWRIHASIGQSALDRKERRLVSLVRSAGRAWHRLHVTFQIKYCTTIRRELQRMSLLRKAIPIPPTPVLDNNWCDNQTTLDLIEVAHSVSLDPRSKRFLLDYLERAYPGEKQHARSH
jgi:hypothetical protein